MRRTESGGRKSTVVSEAVRPSAATGGSGRPTPSLLQASRQA